MFLGTSFKPPVVPLPAPPVCEGLHPSPPEVGGPAGVVQESEYIENIQHHESVKVAVELEVACNLKEHKLKNVEFKENILEKENTEMRKVNTDARRKGVPKICNTENFNNKINF